MQRRSPRMALGAAALALAPAVAGVAFAADAQPPDGVDGDQIAESAAAAARRSDGDGNVFAGDYAIVGVGLGVLPDYEGSGHARILPAAGATGKVGGVGFSLRGPGLTLDLIDDPRGARTGFRLGPSVRWRGNRSGKVHDPVVASLGKLKGGLDAGVSAGISFRRVLTHQDSLSLGVSARWDVSGRSAGLAVSPGVNYLLPVSRSMVTGLHISADWISGARARHDFSVSPTQSLASGLPAYRARGGVKSASAGAFMAIDLNGNLLDGGFSVGAGAMLTRLQGSAAKTPITALRGSRNQWLAGTGIAYAF